MRRVYCNTYVLETSPTQTNLEFSQWSVGSNKDGHGSNNEYRSLKERKKNKTYTKNETTKKSKEKKSNVHEKQISQMSGY